MQKCPSSSSSSWNFRGGRTRVCAPKSTGTMYVAVVRPCPCANTVYKVQRRPPKGPFFDSPASPPQVGHTRDLHTHPRHPRSPAQVFLPGLRRRRFFSAGIKDIRPGTSPDPAPSWRCRPLPQRARKGAWTAATNACPNGRIFVPNPFGRCFQSRV